MTKKSFRSSDGKVVVTLDGDTLTVTLDDSPVKEMTAQTTSPQNQTWGPTGSYAELYPKGAVIAAKVVYRSGGGECSVEIRRDSGADTLRGFTAA